jgi:hypothetical protein
MVRFDKLSASPAKEFLPAWSDFSLRSLVIYAVIRGRPRAWISAFYLEINPARCSRQLYSGEQEMRKEHYLYLILFQGVGAGVLNFFINAAIAMAMFYSIPLIPLWGMQSIMADFLGTIFILSFITSCIVTPMTHKTVATEKLPASTWRRGSHSLLGRLPSKNLPRAAAFGLVFLLVFAPVVIVAVYASDIRELAFREFIIFKGVYAAVLAAIVTPIIALAALGDTAG